MDWDNDVSPIKCQTHIVTVPMLNSDFVFEHLCILSTAMLLATTATDTVWPGNVERRAGGAR